MGDAAGQNSGEDGGRTNAPGVARSTPEDGGRENARGTPRSTPEGLSAAQRRSLGLITAAALALYVGVRLLPTGTNLNHMDFRVTEKGAIEFCDPANPQFIPVVAVKSPVSLAIRSESAPAQNQPARFTLSMATASGKPIGPADLVVAHTRKLHLLVIDPTLNDYQHVHPEAGQKAGEWVFELTPARTGTYLVFADFTPAATGRGLYASAEFTVPGVVPRVTRQTNWDYSAGPYRFTLSPLLTLRAGGPNELKLAVARPDGQPVPLAPVMGAFAHLVMFDEERSGFAHLHPDQVDLAQPPDAVKPELTFKVTVPRAGRYVVWSQLQIEGREVFVPFWVDVLP